MAWADGCLQRSLRGMDGCRRGSFDQAERAVKLSSPAKRKRKAAGQKMAPLIATPTVPVLNDAEWQPFLQLVPSRSELTLLRNKLDWLMNTYLGVLEAEASSPSAREVATVLEGLARRAHQFAQELFSLVLLLSNEGL